MKDKQVIIISLLILTILPIASSQCNPGSYSNGNGICLQCDISCQTCSSSDGCSTCYDQMYLAPVGNQVLCQLCYILNKECSVCITATKCSQCSNGFYLELDQTCSPCSKAVSNCLFCYQNGTSFRCLTCTYPYILINGLCVSNETDIPPSTFGGVVTIQLNQQPIIPPTTSNSQVQNISAQPQINIQQNKSDTNSTPSNCSVSQVSINGTCIQNILYCIQYDVTTLKCKLCYEGYGLSQQSYCIPNNLLTNPTTNPTQYQIPSPPNTITTTSSLTQESTGQDKKCGENQYFWYGGCVSVGTECISRNHLGQCQSCIIGYQLQNGLCMQLPPPSNLAASPPTSSSVNNCTSPCLTCSTVSTYCLTCINNYTTVDVFPGKCFPLNIAN